MTVLPRLTSAASSFVSAATFGHRPWIRGICAFGGTSGFGVFRNVTPAASSSEPDTSSKAYATALNHRCDAIIGRCENWLTAIDHCTRKLLRNLSDTQ